MLFHQLKTLIWRNLVLKKRKPFSTLLEIIIPAVIVWLIGSNIDVNREFEEEDIINYEIVSLDSSSNSFFFNSVFGFIFSPDFDNQKQQFIINSFKSSKIFSEMKYIEPNQNFTKPHKIYDDYSEEIQIVNNMSKRNEQVKVANNNAVRNKNKSTNTTTTAEPKIGNTNITGNSTTYNVTTNGQPQLENNNTIGNITTTYNVTTTNNVNTTTTNENKETYQFKIKIFKNEEELNKELKILEEKMDKDELFIDLIAFEFSSLTKYSIRYKYYWGKELIENIKDTEGYPRHDMLSNSNYIFQTIINKIIIKMLAPNSQDFSLAGTILDKKGCVGTKKDEGFLTFFPLFFLFSYIPCVNSLLVLLVIEKESKIKDSLIIVGLKRSSFWISWAITYGMVIIINTGIAMVPILHYKLFLHTHWSIVLCLLILYGISCCCISFVLSTLIKKSKSASIVGAMIIVVFFSMYFLEMYIKDNFKVLYTICLYTLSPINFISTLLYLLNFDNQNIPMFFMDIFKDQQLRIYFSGFACSILLYIIIAIYLDTVLPQGSNLHKKWHFFITDCFKSKKKRNLESKSFHSNNPYIQEDPKDMKRAVEISNIVKTFKVKGEKIEILKGINFNGYYNEIFAILGHNGAGKTTLMNIMTGILSATQGDVYYDDVPLNGHETDICKQFGYCPQFDTFNNNLTVGEHIKLFGGIKNIKVDVDSVLEDIDLLNKKSNYPKELTAGQKRKLCISLALLGSPKFVFLDEPTTGLDPYSRKNIWELLSRKREGRVIFVTTHYMDEADLLADRKMIISNGNISCLGSSLFLKQQFNMNYSLDINCQDVRDGSITDRMLDYFCPGTSKTKKISKTNMNINNSSPTPTTPMSNGSSNNDYLITYLLPMKSAGKFKYIFEELNKMIRSPRNSIKNFSLTAPTLEELFINLEKNDMGNTQFSSSPSSPSPTFSSSSPRTPNTSMTSSIDMDYGNNNSLKKLNPMFNRTVQRKPSFFQQVFAIVKLRLKIFIRNKTFAFLYTLFPVAIVILCMYLVNTFVNTENHLRKYKPLNITPSLYRNENWFKESNVTLPALGVLNEISPANSINLDTVSYANDISLSSGKDRSKLNYIGGFYGKNQLPQGLQFVIYVNSTDIYAPSIGIDLLSNAILKQNNINDRFSITYHPFDSISFLNEKDEMINLNTIKEKVQLEPLLIVCITLAISLSISIFGPYIVKEREEGITHQIFLNGTKRINYWLGVLISDSICLFVPVLIISIAGYLYGISVFHYKLIALTMGISIVWIIGCLLNQYVFCYFFKKYERISILLIIINPIINLGLSILIMATPLIYEEEPKNDVDLKTRTTMYKLYVASSLFVPAFIILFYSKLSSLIKLKAFSFDTEEVEKFLSSEKANSIVLNIKLSNKEKSNLLKKAFLDPKYPSIMDVFQCKDRFIYLVMIIVADIVVFGFILYLLEKMKKKRLRKVHEYTLEERSEKNKKNYIWSNRYS